MSSNTHHINLSNYEEYFILYMDNELSPSEKAAVDDFISIHPHLVEELQLFLSTKLPAEEISFGGKEELFSASMKMTLVDEELLLYVDDELSAARRTVVEQKIVADKDYALQYSLLMQTKADASESISYPNKKELYRFEEKVRRFPVWMRVAAAVIILLSGSLYFIIGSTKQGLIEPPVASKQNTIQPAKQIPVPEQKDILAPQQKETPVLVKKDDAKKSSPSLVTAPDVSTKNNIIRNNIIVKNDAPSTKKREIISLDVTHLTTTPSIANLGINKTITRTPVTTKQDSAYNNQNTQLQSPDAADWAVENGKKTKGKGFFRRVSRFIERNTGIGTVNADNELLVGAVALKLK